MFVCDITYDLFISSQNYFAIGNSYDGQKYKNSQISL